MTSCSLSFLAIGTGLLLSLLTGCAHKPAPEPVLKPEAISQRECMFQKIQINAEPEELVRDYLKRDADGEFTLASNWFESVNLCPGHEEAPEVHYVTKSMRIDKTEVNDGHATVHVSYSVIGEIEYDGANDSWHFIRGPKKEKRTYKLVHTEYGWRFRAVHLADGQFLSVDTAKARLTSESDKDALIAAARKGHRQ